MSKTITANLRHPLAASQDSYRVISISTAHLSPGDIIGLDSLANDSECQMVMKRDTGYFVKLYDDIETNNGFIGHSDSFDNIVINAYEAGYRMIEFDCDATIYACLPAFEE